MANFAETSKLLEESRKIHEDDQDTNIGSLLHIFLNLVTAMHTSIKRIETGMNKIDEIKTTVTALAYDIRKLTEDVKGIERKYNVLETTVQGMSDMFDELKEKSSMYTKDLKTMSEKINVLEHKLKYAKKINHP